MMLDQQTYLHTFIYSKTTEMNTQSSDAKMPMQPIKQLAARLPYVHNFLEQADKCKRWQLKTKIESKT
jgi:hypothetical protein